MVGADDADERGAATERHDVVRRVCRAAKPQILGLEPHDWDRRLRRDARHAADDEAIEHHVADDEDREAGEAIDQLAGATRVKRWQLQWMAVGRP